MKCEAVWHQQPAGGVVPVPPTEVPSLMGLDWLFEHTDSEPDDAPCSNPGELICAVAPLGCSCSQVHSQSVLNMVILVICIITAIIGTLIASVCIV